MDAQIEMLTLQLNAALATLNEIRGGAALKPVKASKGKAVKTDKVPRAPTSWGLFRTRVSTLLKDNDVPIKLSPEMLQFCSRLKTEKTPDEWTDESILAARRSWLAPPKKAKSTEATPAESDEEAPAPVKAAPKKAPAKKAEAAPAEAEEEYDEAKMDGNETTIGGKTYLVNAYGDVFDNKLYTYLGSKKGDKLVPMKKGGQPPARVVKYLA